MRPRRREGAKKLSILNGLAPFPKELTENPLCTGEIWMGSFSPAKFGGMMPSEAWRGCVFKNRMEHFVVHDIAHDVIRDFR